MIDNDLYKKNVKLFSGNLTILVDNMNKIHRIFNEICLYNTAIFT